MLLILLVFLARLVVLILSTLLIVLILLALLVVLILLPLLTLLILLFASGRIPLTTLAGGLGGRLVGIHDEDSFSVITAACRGHLLGR